MDLFGSTRDARRFLLQLIVVLWLPLLVLAFLIQPFKVEGRSMQPGLMNGERILVNKLAARIGTIERGDIVVFHSPADPGRTLVKRVVGLPGETIEIRTGSLLVDGRPLLEAEHRGKLPATVELGPVRLGGSAYFVLGDNRIDSEDSRIWGPLERRLILGRAAVAYWPLFAAGPLD